MKLLENKAHKGRSSPIPTADPNFLPKLETDSKKSPGRMNENQDYKTAQTFTPKIKKSTLVKFPSTTRLCKDIQSTNSISSAHSITK